MVLVCMNGKCETSTFDFLNSAARHKVKETRAEAMMSEKKSGKLYWFRLSIYVEWP